MRVCGQLIFAGIEQVSSLPNGSAGQEVFLGRVVQLTSTGAFYIYTSSGWSSLAISNAANQTFTGTVTATEFIGDLDGDVVGNVTGNLSGTTVTAQTITATTGFSGPLTGNVTGNVSGTAANVTGTVAIANGGTGQTAKTAAFDALSPTTTKGDLIVSDGTDNVRLGVGTDGYGLVADAAQTAGVKWAPVLSNPMTTTGDIIVAGASGTPGRLAIGGTGTFLKSNGTTLVYDDIDLDADIAGTLPVANGGTGITAFGAGVATALGQNVLGSGKIVLGTDEDAVLNLILPDQSGNNGKVLATDGSTTSWAAGLTSTLASGSIFVGNGSSVATAVALNALTDNIATTGTLAAGNTTITGTASASTHVSTPLLKAYDGNGIIFQENGGTQVGSISDAGLWNIGPSAGGVTHLLNGDLQYSDTTFLFTANTSDGSDTKRIQLCGGGSNSSTRGAYIILAGNEFGSSQGGLAQYVAGDKSEAAGSNAAHVFYGSATAGAGGTVVFRLNGDGTTTIGSTAGTTSAHTVYGNTSSSGNSLDIHGMNLRMGSDNTGSVITRTDGVGKRARFTMPHFTTAEEDVSVFISGSDSGNNFLNIGGGSSSWNAVTNINFYTGSSATTATGTLKGSVSSSGWTIGTASSSTDIHTVNGRWNHNSNGGEPGMITMNSGYYFGFEGASASQNPGIRIAGKNGSGTTFNNYIVGQGSGSTLRFQAASGLEVSANGGTSNGFSVDANHKVTLGTLTGTQTHVAYGFLDVYQASSGAGSGISVGLRVEDDTSTGIEVKTPTANNFQLNHCTPLDQQSAGIKFYGSDRKIEFYTVNGATRGSIDNAGSWILGTTTATATHYAQVGESTSALTILSYAATASSTRRILDLRYMTDTDCTGGMFLNCMNSSGTTIGHITATSNGAASYTASDERLKQDPADFDGLAIAMALQPKEFAWKSNPQAREKGLYAQEAHAVLPEIVSVGLDDLTESGALRMPWGVDYGRLTPVLLKAIQQLSAKNDALEARIAALEGAA